MNCEYQDYPLPNKNVSSYIIDKELIIFDARSKAMLRMNETASDIWCLHEDSHSIEQIAEYLSRKYNIAKAKIHQDVNNALDGWHAMGILGDDFVPSVEEPENVLAYMREADASSLDKQLYLMKVFKYLDSTFSICVSDQEIEKILVPLYSHFPVSSIENTHTIKVIAEENEFIILDGTKAVACCNEINEIAPIINAHILTTSLYQVDCLSVFHAGVIQHNDGVVLLSAGSGSGKSTLTAALMCSGKNLFTDELAILTHDQNIRPAPGCVGLKKGSWKVISPYFPSISELQTHHRLDDKKVKFLPPLSFPSSEQLEKGEPVKAIIFPNYSAAYETDITSISAADALVKLTDSGYHMNQSLSHESVKNLIEWIKNIPAYELRVNNLDDAVSLVTKLL